MSSMPVGGVRPAKNSTEVPADVVVRNARVFTGDPARPAATAMAIRDGVFVAVGDDQDVAPFVGAATRVFDAINRRVIPGLNDSPTASRKRRGSLRPRSIRRSSVHREKHRVNSNCANSGSGTTPSPTTSLVAATCSC
jgi:N-acyl-D-aspartate/D-glutamate deacylase